MTVSHTSFASGPHGVRVSDGACEFRVWAPHRERIELVLTESGRTIELDRHGDGFFRKEVPGALASGRYFYRIDGGVERPDPASRFQPAGVHGPSEVVADDFEWRAAVPTLALEDYVIYELHIGTFTAEGTFDAAIDRLDDLVELGVTAVEPLPIAAFPGTRNWGYDGAHPFAVQASYGGPDGLRRFVDACHARGLVVVMDVVYNHLGPEGTYLADFGPYFTDAYATPWGSAVNFDRRDSDPVRDYFLQNALMWVDAYRVDALRLDAVHAIIDGSALPFLEELTTTLHQFGRANGRTVHVIAETNRNDPRTVLPPERGGQGHDAMWVDDLHHALHAAVTEESHGYYADYGGLDCVVEALRCGMFLRGQHSRYRGRRQGRDPGELEPHRIVTYLQNHDQTGNRQNGDRITALCGVRRHRMLATALLLAPYTPMLFMGEEYGELAPFPYFVDHGDASLLEAVRAGRRRQFASFEWEGEPPDPADPRTYESAKLDWRLREEGQHAALLDLYGALIALRKRTRATIGLSRSRQEVTRHGDVVLLRRWDTAGGREQLVAINFGADCVVPLDRRFEVVLDTGASRFAGEPHEVSLGAGNAAMPAHTAAVFEIV